MIADRQLAVARRSTRTLAARVRAGRAARLPARRRRPGAAARSCSPPPTRGAFTEPELVYAQPARCSPSATCSDEAGRVGTADAARCGRATPASSFDSRRADGRRRASRSPRGRTSRPGSPRLPGSLTRRSRADCTPARTPAAAGVGGRVPAARCVVLALAGSSGCWQLWHVRRRVGGRAPQVLPSPLRVLEQGWAFRGEIWANTRADAAGHRGRVRGVAGAWAGRWRSPWTSRRGCGAR